MFKFKTVTDWKIEQLDETVEKMLNERSEEHTSELQSH